MTETKAKEIAPFTKDAAISPQFWAYAKNQNELAQDGSLGPQYLKSHKK